MSTVTVYTRLSICKLLKNKGVFMKNTVQTIIEFILDCLWVGLTTWLIVSPLVVILPWLLITALIFINANKKTRGKYGNKKGY